MSEVEDRNIEREDAATRARLHRMGAVLLAAGLFSAAAIYVASKPEAVSGAIGYEIIDGKSYPIMPGDSKRYQHDLEAIGGKSAVLASELTEGFNGLWRGRRLAYTLVFLGTGGFLGCLFLANRLTCAPLPEDPSGQGRPG